jgi:hypothetical protein
MVVRRLERLIVDSWAASMSRAETTRLALLLRRVTVALTAGSLPPVCAVTVRSALRSMLRTRSHSTFLASSRVKAILTSLRASPALSSAQERGDAVNSIPYSERVWSQGRVAGRWRMLTLCTAVRASALGRRRRRHMRRARGGLRMSRASCLCGLVTWELGGPYVFMHHRHCGRCRKAHGTPFATFIGGPQDRFHLDGSEHVVTWEPPSGSARSFCGRCGSVVPGAPFSGLVFSPAGNFEDDLAARPSDHIFVASKASWYEIADDLPRHDAYPPGIDVAVLPDPPRSEPPPGTVRGSCLCGAVAYAIEAPPLLARYCHCSRCRRARSAAHAANMFLAADNLRFTRGEDHLTFYKVPEAQRFAQVFCRACGSPMPRVDRERGIAVVPMGSLDDDPGMTPEAHIYVGSRAPWFTIADRLPQFEDSPTQ